MGIIHTAKKNIKEELLKKRQKILLEEKKREDINAIITTREMSEVFLFLKIFHKFKSNNNK